MKGEKEARLNMDLNKQQGKCVRTIWKTDICLISGQFMEISDGLKQQRSKPKFKSRLKQLTMHYLHIWL